ncbi:uncharacterized protein B0H18DRAFT_536205 [Fomitopsis serialis]|uniref:uncharacterized protein n=1 Tax=Fomitopsis serialis TaxID=139415 RepID=UPI002007B251|nr:uncharacterized protein B0H18DRAFT_536205 [Neoantrodia serialis]KAH9921748.1 hypothetical protein B0H18DRAFT_536205 [Neoantrodia serialis]
MAWRRMRLIFLFAKPCMASRSCSGLSVGSAAFNVLYSTRERITRGFRQPYSRHTVGSGTVNSGRTDGYTVRGTGTPMRDTIPSLAAESSPCIASVNMPRPFGAARSSLLRYPTFALQMVKSRYLIHDKKPGLLTFLDHEDELRVKYPASSTNRSRQLAIRCWVALKATIPPTRDRFPRR